MRKILVAMCLLFAQVGNSMETPIETDLHWYKQTLRSFQLPLKEVDSFLNPLKGPQSFRLNAQNAPWAGNYYPMTYGGIGNRWQEGYYPENPLNRELVLKMSEQELRKLSPVEKFDILRGDYKFSATHHEMNLRGPYRSLPVEQWEGFCNGVRCAGLNLAEPKFEVTVVNPDGVKVTFLPADLKALAGASYFYTEKYGQLGRPTKESMYEAQPNPAIFDLALRYHLAQNNKGFVIDTHLGSEIWNETVVGYKRTLTELPLNNSEKQKYPKAVKKYSVDLVIDTLGEVSIGDSNGPTKHDVANGKHLGYVMAVYELYINAKGKAIDGVWMSNTAYDSRGVDFAWFGAGEGADAKNSDKGGNPYLDFKKIETLFKKSSAPFCKSIFM